MIGIGTAFTYHFNRFIHGKCLVFHKNTNQLRNNHGWMRVIDLDDCMLIHLTKIILLLLHLMKNQLCRITYHEILLINTEQIARLIRIIRIKE